MKDSQWKKLEVGDLIRHKRHYEAYIVTDVVPQSDPLWPPKITAVRVITAFNPPEWDQVDLDGQIIEKYSMLDRKNEE